MVDLLEVQNVAHSKYFHTGGSRSKQKRVKAHEMIRIDRICILRDNTELVLYDYSAISVSKATVSGIERMILEQDTTTPEIPRESVTAHVVYESPCCFLN